MTLEEFISAAEEKITKAGSVVVTLTKLVDKADNAADMIPSGILPENVKEARAVLDQIRAILDQAAGIIGEVKEGQPCGPGCDKGVSEIDTTPGFTSTTGGVPLKLGDKTFPFILQDEIGEADPEPAPEAVKVAKLDPKVKVAKLDPKVVADRLAASRAKGKDNGNDGTT